MKDWAKVMAWQNKIFKNVDTNQIDPSIDDATLCDTKVFTFTLMHIELSIAKA